MNAIMYCHAYYSAQSSSQPPKWFEVNEGHARGVFNPHPQDRPWSTRTLQPSKAVLSIWDLLLVNLRPVQPTFMPWLREREQHSFPRARRTVLNSKLLFETFAG